MRTLAIIAACCAWLCVDCTAHASPATDAIKACAPYRDLIRDAAEAASVPASLLTALVFAESTCDPNAINERSLAVGLGQLMTMGAGAGHTTEELKDAWLNLTLSAAHLAKWRKRCGSWRGAIRVYHGNPTCKTPSSYADKVIAMWRAIERRERPKS